MNVGRIVALSVKHNVSDLHLCNAWPTRQRIHSRMEAAPLDTPDVEELLQGWLDDDQRATLLENGQLDFAVSLAENQRLRGNAFAQRYGISLALRLSPSYCPQLERLDASAILPELLESESGLTLVTGATGSGKSATLVAMVGYLNQRTDAHILALEDPVEYLYASQRCLAQQWKTGLHYMMFASGLRAVLREDPDVILLGELRDSETIRLALTAIEIRHLVSATLHVRGTTQAVERLVDSSPARKRNPVCNQLAGSLQTVLSQELEVDRQEERVALFELLINIPMAGSLVRKGKTHQLSHVIQIGQQVGMVTFQQSYQHRVGEGRL